MQQIKFEKFVKILNKNGFYLVRTNGSHFIYKNKKHTLSIKKPLKSVISLRLIKEFNLCV